MWRSNTRAQSTEVVHQIMLHGISPVTLYRSCIRRLIHIHWTILCSYFGWKIKWANFFYPILPFITHFDPLMCQRISLSILQKPIKNRSLKSFSDSKIWSPVVTHSIYWKFPTCPNLIARKTLGAKGTYA